MVSSIKNIPFFDYPRLYKDDKDSFLSIFNDTCERGAFIMQKDVELFEQNLSNFINCEYSVGVANATDGLELCWLAAGLEKGDEVICSSHTMLATASSIKLSGGLPIPVDIGEDNLINPECVEAAINSRTVGIMPTQLNGRVCDMEAIMNIAKKNNLIVIEDAAQSLGAKYCGKSSGTFGLASAISFFPAKVLGSFGDAGAVVTNNPEMFDKIYQLHDHGRDINGEVKSWGRNSRLDNLQAAFLNYKFKSYQKTIERRREIADIYDLRLRSIEEINLPPGPSNNSKNFDVYQNYELTAAKRDKLKIFLSNNGIGTLIQWGGKGIHQWKVLGFKENLPKTEEFFKTCLMLPMNMFISDDDIHYICDKIIEFYRS